MNCLNDWCTEVVQFCMAKSKYKDSPPPLMASPSVGKVGGCAWREDSFRGAWCKYNVVSGLVGDAVTLSELVGFSYSLCELIYPKYSAICVEIEQAIMKRVDDGGCCSMVNDEEENDEVDRGFQEIIPPRQKLTLDDCTRV